MIRWIVWGLIVFSLIFCIKGENWKEVEEVQNAELKSVQSAEEVELNSHDSSEEEGKKCYKNNTNPRVSCSGGDNCVDTYGRPCHSKKKEKETYWWIVFIICLSVIVGIILLSIICIKLGWCCCCQHSKISTAGADVGPKNENDYIKPPPSPTGSRVWTTGKMDHPRNATAPIPPPYIEKVPEYATV